MNLIKYGYINIPSYDRYHVASSQILGTVISNLTYYGFTLDKDAFEQLKLASDNSIKSWWSALEPILKELTGDNLQMDKFVVYKNFPAEVLDKNESEYWIAQILMYWGLPNEYFTQDEQPRDKMLEKLSLKVLQPQREDSHQKILDSLLMLPNRWVSSQLDDVRELVALANADPSKIPFKENLIELIKILMDSGIKPQLKSATDVLRLAIGLSGGDLTGQTPSKFRPFKRSEQRFLLGLLEKSTSLEEDMARDKLRWKKFLKNLHPNNYNYPKVSAAYDKLYNGKVKSFNGLVEPLLLSGDKQVLKLLQSRPGEFMRRLYKTISLFNNQSIAAFIEVLPRLSTIQLLKIKKYVETINKREYRTIAPKGSWSKLQILNNENEIGLKNESRLVHAIKGEIAKRVNTHGSFSVDPSVSMVKLQTNDGDTCPYGRGTVFLIPNEAKFIRTASYWEKENGGYNAWFDNGWNFFDDAWKNVGCISWDNGMFPFNGYFAGRAKNNPQKAAVFSGDPTNSKEMKGRACQMIDLYPEKLLQCGVRYAVWNILCYSRIKFKDAKVFAALQWGEEPQKGKLFEPSRCQLSFPLQGDYFTKYVAYIDMKERKLVYMDANLKANTQSASRNGATLEKVMPAFVEYLDTLPSVYDLFEGAKEGDTRILYTDENEAVHGEAYVFQKRNEASSFNQINLGEILA